MTDTSYDNLVVAVSDYEIGFQPKKPEQTPDFPFELKVHITRGEGHARAFAELIGKRLSSDRKKFVYQDRRRVKPENATFVEKRANPIKKSMNHLTRTEARHWKNTAEFSQTGFIPYITFTLIFRKREQLALFAKRVKQKITLNTPSINFPAKRPRAWKYHWVSKWDDCNPKYPVYIVSKGRADSRLTANAFERYSIPYFIVIEPQDYDAYASVIDEEKILVLPFSNHGDGPGRARNWEWSKYPCGVAKTKAACDFL
jgi:hypothetical protein